MSPAGLDGAVRALSTDGLPLLRITYFGRGHFELAGDEGERLANVLYVGLPATLPSERGWTASREGPTARREHLRSVFGFEEDMRLGRIVRFADLKTAVLGYMDDPALGPSEPSGCGWMHDGELSATVKRVMKHGRADEVAAWVNVFMRCRAFAATFATDTVICHCTDRARADVEEMLAGLDDPNPFRLRYQ